MKKVQSFKYLIVGLSLILLGSCTDFLDIDPKNKIPGESVLSDPNGVKKRFTQSGRNGTSLLTIGGIRDIL